MVSTPKKKTTLPSAKNTANGTKLIISHPEKPELRFRGWDLFCFSMELLFNILNTASGVMCAPPMYTNRFGVHGAMHYVYKIYIYINALWDCQLFVVCFVDQFDWLGEKNQQPYGGGVAKTKTPHPCELLPGAKAVVLMICTRPINSFVGFLFSVRGWKTETIRNSWGGQLLSWCLLLILLKREWSVYNRSISCMYYIWIMHISHISMCLANVYMMINYICCCLRRYFGYGTNH